MTKIAKDRYAVMGNPITHSKSPMIHQLFAEQTEQHMEYEKILVETGDFANAVKTFASNNGKGLNITVPFKLEAFELAHHKSARAKRAGAVNTLILSDPDVYFGDNTDGAGLVRDLTNNLGISLTDKSILILGAGGAVRGVLEPVLNEHPSSIVIANRTIEKAIQLASDFADLGNISGCGFSDLDGQQFDLIINGTAASLSGDLPPLPENMLKEDTAVYDMMYGKEPTVFMQWATTHGCADVFDGLGMLVEQAAESFYLWRQEKPETGPVLKKVRESL